jgi:hypothetical protein
MTQNYTLTYELNNDGFTSRTANGFKIWAKGVLHTG